MSSLNQLQLRNSEGDTALLILLSIYAYEDFDVLAKTIMDSIDKNSAVKTKQDILDNVLSKDKRFSITNSYKKNLTITATRTEDTYGNLITKPISTQLKKVSEFQAKLDKIVLVDDIGSDPSARDVDLFFKKVESMTTSDTDGTIFDNYKKIKGGKSLESSEDSEETPDKSKETDKNIDPFDLPEVVSEKSEELDKESKDSKKKEASKKEEEDVPLSGKDKLDNEKKEKIMGDNIPFYKSGMNNLNNNDFALKAPGIKINDNTNGKSDVKDDQLAKDKVAKDDVIKDALPFTELSMQKATDAIKGTTPEDEAPESKNKKTVSEEVDILDNKTTDDEDIKKKKKEEDE